MKSSAFFIVLLLFLALASCHKEDNPPQYCYQIVHPGQDSAILSDVDLAMIRSLFVANNLDYSSYQFYSFTNDEFGNYHIAGFHIFNGLKLFNGTMAFHFDSSGKLVSMNGDIVSGISLDTIPSTDPVSAIRLYIQELNRDQMYSYRKVKIEYGCFNAEFGYYEDRSNSGAGTGTFIKTWKITPEGAEFPYAYINDETSKLITYSNGIIVN